MYRENIKSEEEKIKNPFKLYRLNNKCSYFEKIILFIGQIYYPIYRFKKILIHLIIATSLLITIIELIICVICKFSVSYFLLPLFCFPAYIVIFVICGELLENFCDGCAKIFNINLNENN